MRLVCRKRYAALALMACNCAFMLASKAYGRGATLVQNGQMYSNMAPGWQSIACCLPRLLPHQCRVVFPCRSLASTHAPASSRTRATSACPHAQCSAVQPSTSAALGSAPDASSSCTSATSPDDEACRRASSLLRLSGCAACCPSAVAASAARKVPGI